MISRGILNGFLILGFIGVIQGAATMQETPANLTAIKWAHAVNNVAFLKQTLESKVDMIEADIIYGFMKGDNKTQLPIMGHPPQTESDLSLETFLQNITDHNNKIGNSAKGIKLDFKTLDGFDNSVEILKNYSKTIKIMWLNADILKGPGNPQGAPLDPAKFFKNSKEISDNNTLSIGWTTALVKDPSKVKYDESQINDMIATIKNNGIVNRNITFPVRAVYAVNSEKELNGLLKKTDDTKNNATLSIWSDAKDHTSVDVKKLRDLIKNVGVHRVYLDVPIELEREIRLNSSPSLKVSFINFTIISIIMVFLSEYLKE